MNMVGPELLTDISNVKLRSGDEVILEIPKFRICSGSWSALVGENGAGKTSFLRLLAGIWKQYDGEFVIFSSTASGLSPVRRNRMGLATVLDTRIVFPEMTVNQLLLWRKPLALSAKDGDALLLRVCRRVESLGESQLAWLSGGERALVGMVAAVDASTRVLLIDDWYEGLDESAVLLIEGLIQWYQGVGISGVVTSATDRKISGIMTKKWNLRRVNNVPTLLEDKSYENESA